MFKSIQKKLSEYALSSEIPSFGSKLKDLNIDLQIREKDSSIILIISSSESIDLNLVKGDLEQALKGFSSKKPIIVTLLEEKKRPYKKLIAIASGKGGVGKSTICANLAYAAAKQGFKVGLVDADIYGPSLHHLLGIKRHEPEIKNGLMVPPEKNGIKLMSMGFMVPEDSALIWRGAMLTKSLNNLINGTSWGELDYLFVDMPPGTGDIYLSLAKTFKVDGAVIIATPQKLALLDVKRSIDFFKKLNISILGIVSNMSYYYQGSEKKYIFGKSLESFVKENHLELLEEIPLMPEISSISDNEMLITEESLSEIYERLKRVILKII